MQSEREQTLIVQIPLLCSKAMEEPSLFAKSNEINQNTDWKYALIAVVIGFSTVITFGSVATGTFAYIKLHDLETQTSILSEELTTMEVLQLQNSVSALWTQLNSLSKDVIDIQSTKNDTLLRIVFKVYNTTGPPGTY